MEETEIGASLGPIWTLPFVGILLSIALCPLFVPALWHKRYRQIAVGWALIFALPFVFVFRETAVHLLLETLLHEYLSFIIVLLALFVVTGGILVRGTLLGTPMVNSIILLTGTLIASLVGTTGASVLLIRPLLRANRNRKYRVHTIMFFIFLVSNIGGVLTPLGDPPLFLGFLNHVPFFWTLEHLWPHYLVAVGILLPAYFLWDWLCFRFLETQDVRIAIPAEQHEPLRLEGKGNILLLVGILLVVLGSGMWQPRDWNVEPLLKEGAFHLLGLEFKVEKVGRDLALLLLVALSLLITPKRIRVDNGFTWYPIEEVAVLFFGIFVTIIGPLEILGAGERGALRTLVMSVESPSHYFFMTGLLSSVLDNAPTYLTFFETALGRFAPGLTEEMAVASLIQSHANYLAAISVGAVFMGANTYIGNAPNFMVRAIAEESKIKMPNFFTYIFLYAIPILGPIYAIIWWLFFRG